MTKPLWHAGYQSKLSFKLLFDTTTLWSKHPFYRWATEKRSDLLKYRVRTQAYVCVVSDAWTTIITPGAELQKMRHTFAHRHNSSKRSLWTLSFLVSFSYWEIFFFGKGCMSLLGFVYTICHTGSSRENQGWLEKKS